MFVRNWIDIIRSKEYLDLIPRNKNRGKIPIVDLSFNDIPIRTSYDHLYRVTNVSEHLYGKPPTLMSFTNYEMNNMAVKKDKRDMDAKHDEMIVANGVLFVWTKEEANKLSRGGIRNHQFTVHRDDGYPAVLEMVNVRRRQDRILGVLNGVGKEPALSCEYLIAHWYKDNKKYRKTGPLSLCFESYKEYWDVGRYRGYRYLDLTINDRYEDDDLEELKNDYDIDIFRNSIFLDPLDEMDYIAKRL